MTHAETLEYLDHLAGSGIKLGLQTMRRLLQGLDSPQDRVRAIHIAGSNGKGSVAAFLSSILTSAGYRVGLYTSPHLVQVEERIAIDGEPILPERLAAACTHVRARADSLRAAGSLDREPTYFEFLTAVAFHVFRDEECDLQVVEAGLGGRLDATNVIDKPLACVITRIDLEHTNLLGSTAREIAVEKAGIARAGVPVLTLERDPETLAALREAVGRSGATLVEVAAECRTQTHADGAVDIRVGRTAYKGLSIPLPGEHQLDNLALALRTLGVLATRGYAVDPATVRLGVERTRWPGRLEVVRTNPTVLLDGAHNPAGARALARYLETLGPDGDLLLVFGVMEDKDIPGVMEPLLRRASRVLLTRAPLERAASLELLAPVARRLHADVTTVALPGEALERALALARPQDTVLVTGSLLLVGAVKKHLATRGDI